MPIIRRKLKASIRTVGLRWMKAPSGPEATIITATATTTATTMIGNSLVMPTAVMMLSIEKTMSISTIWTNAAITPSRAGVRPRLVLAVRLDPLVDLPRRLPHQEQAARQQEQVAHRKRMAEHGRERLGQADDRGGRGEQREAEDERQRQAEAARERPPARLDPVRQERDEDEIVDPEHDLHGDQGRQRRPCGGIGGEPDHRVHAMLLSGPRRCALPS